MGDLRQASEALPAAAMPASLTDQVLDRFLTLAGTSEAVSSSVAAALALLVRAGTPLTRAQLLRATSEAVAQDIVDSSDNPPHGDTERASS